MQPVIPFRLTVRAFELVDMAAEPRGRAEKPVERIAFEWVGRLTTFEEPNRPSLRHVKKARCCEDCTYEIDWEVPRWFHYP